MQAIQNASTLEQLKTAIVALAQPLPEIHPVLGFPSVDINLDAMRLLGTDHKLQSLDVRGGGGKGVEAQIETFLGISQDSVPTVQVTSGLDEEKLEEDEAEAFWGSLSETGGGSAEKLDAEDRKTADLALQNLRLLTGEYAGGKRRIRAHNALAKAYDKAQKTGKTHYIFAKSTPTPPAERGLGYFESDNFQDWHKFNYQGEYLAYEVNPNGIVRALRSKPLQKQVRMEVQRARAALDIFRSYNYSEAQHLAAHPELIDQVAHDMSRLGSQGRALSAEVLHFLSTSDGERINAAIGRGAGPAGQNDLSLQIARSKIDQGFITDLANTCQLLIEGTLPPSGIRERKIVVLKTMLDWVKSIDPELPDAMEGFGYSSSFDLPVSDANAKKIILHMRFAVPMAARIKFGLAFLTRANRRIDENGNPWFQPMVDALEYLLEKETKKPSIFKPVVADDLVRLYLNEWQGLSLDRMSNLELSLIWDAYRGRGDEPVGALPSSLTPSSWSQDLNGRLLPVMFKNEPNYLALHQKLESKNASRANDLEAYRNRFTEMIDDERDSDRGDGGDVGGDDGDNSSRRVLGERDIQRRYADSGVTLIRREKSGIPIGESLSPEYSQPLRQHQRDGVNLILDAHKKAKGFLLSDGTGAGKTMVQIATALHYADEGKKVLIVIPKAEILESAFKVDIQRFRGDLSNRMLWFKDAPLPIEKGRIYVTAYHLLNDCKDEGWDIIIFDEAHKCKNLLNKKPSKQAEIARDMMERAEKVVCATATPMDKGFHVAYLCEMYGFDTEAMMARLGQKRTDLGWERDPEVEPEQEAVAIEEFFDVLTASGLMVKREVSMDKVDYVNQEMELSPDYSALYDFLNDAYAKEYEEKQGLAKARYRAKWLLGMRRVLDFAKTDTAARYAIEEIRQGRKAVVFCASVTDTQDLISFVETARGKLEGLNDQQISRLVSDLSGAASTGRITKAIQDAGYKAFEFVGKASAKTRNKAMIEFQDGDLDAIVTTPQSGGTGINLDDSKGPSNGGKPRTVIMTQPPFSGNDIIQALGRVNRLTTQSRSKVIQLTTQTSIDFWNQGLVATKLARLGAAVKGDYGKIDLKKIADLDNGEIVRYLKESGISTQRPVEIRNDRPTWDIDDAEGPIKELDSIEEFIDIPEGQFEAIQKLEQLAPFNLKHPDMYRNLVSSSFLTQGAYPNPVIMYGPPQVRGREMFADWRTGLRLLSECVGKPMNTLAYDIRVGKIALYPPPAEIPEPRQMVLFKGPRKANVKAMVREHGGYEAADYKGAYKVPVERWQELLTKAEDERIRFIKLNTITEGKSKFFAPSDHHFNLDLF
jgi:hypothetical protein